MKIKYFFIVSVPYIFPADTEVVRAGEELIITEMDIQDTDGDDLYTMCNICSIGYRRKIFLDLSKQQLPWFQYALLKIQAKFEVSEKR